MKTINIIFVYFKFKLAVINQNESKLLSISGLLGRAPEIKLDVSSIAVVDIISKFAKARYGKG